MLFLPALALEIAQPKLIYPTRPHIIRPIEMERATLDPALGLVGPIAAGRRRSGGGGGGATIALDAHTAAGVSTLGNPIATPQTFSHTCGSGSNRLLVVTVQMRGGAGGVVTGVTYNGVSMTQVTTEALSASAHATMYYLVNPDSGTHTVSVAHSLTGSTNIVISATSLEGVDQSTPLDASNKAAASSTGPMSTAVTTTVDDCWVIDSCSMRTQAGETATMTAATNRTERTNSNTASAGLRGLVSTLGPAGAAGSKTMEWTKTLNHDWAIMAAAFAPA